MLEVRTFKRVLLGLPHIPRGNERRILGDLKVSQREGRRTGEGIGSGGSTIRTVKLLEVCT